MIVGLVFSEQATVSVEDRWCSPSSIHRIIVSHRGPRIHDVHSTDRRRPGQ
jgi:hypothetical protein